MSSDAVPAYRLISVNDLVHGVRVHARVSARPFAEDQTPIVFVHGLGLSVRYLEPTMSRLARDHPVAGLDLPGFGRSATPSEILDIHGLSTALVGWLDARGIGPAIFVGTSHGCQVIIDLVIHEPARVFGLVLNAPTMDPAYRTVGRQLSRMLADVPYEPWTLALIGVRDYIRAGAVRILTTLRHALDDHIEAKLPRIVAPTLVVCGARDPLVTVEWATEVSRLVGIAALGAAGASLHVAPAAAHALPYDDPVLFATLITKLVARARAVNRGR